MPVRSGSQAHYFRLMCDDEDSDLKGVPTLPSAPTQARRWVLGSELAELWRMDADPAFEQDLERMGGEMIDPWA